MSVHRIFNFAAGPAILPLPVLEEAQRDLVALPGVGMSVMEISHRSKTFEGILQQAEADMRTLAGIPADYKVVFLQGGASLQFSMVPMNLLSPGATADYIITGDWAKKAMKEAKRVGATHVAASTEEGNFKRIPHQDELKLTAGAAYVHMTSNNTIHGTEWSLPDRTSAPPRSCAMPRRTSFLGRSTWPATASSTPAPRRIWDRRASPWSSCATTCWPARRTPCRRCST